MLDNVTLVRGDITAQSDVDAVVSCLPVSLVFRGSLNQSLLNVAGNGLDSCVLEEIYKPRLGDVYALPAFDLPVKHIIFTIVANWHEKPDIEDRDVIRCYRQPLKLASQMKLRRLAFPAIGAGHNALAPARVARFAIAEMEDGVAKELEEIRIVCIRDDIYDAFSERLHIVQNGG